MLNARLRLSTRPLVAAKVCISFGGNAKAVGYKKKCVFLPALPTLIP
jgi:hypothetical protein